MNVTWIIENYAKENSFKELIAAVKRAGLPLIEINKDYKSELLQPLFELKDPINSFELKNQCVIVNGSIKMCKLLKDDLHANCSPVSYSTFENYKCSSYYSHFGPYLFNDKYCLMSLKEIVRQKYDIFGHYGKEGLVFIRPDSGEKTFQAGLVDIVDIDKLHENNRDIEHDLMLVSTPKNILWEGRFVVSKYKEIIAHSTYRFQGQVTKIPSVPPETIKFVNEILNKIEYYPDSVFCLDICQDNDKDCWLMELTSFSSAGLYECNMDNIVKRVSEIAIEDCKNKYNEFYIK